MFRLILMLICTCAFAQQSQRPPKIALVLEGGSALGLAHIGVLEWMEENRIPIHLITGASMGALIGGLYASGMSTQEIRSLVESIDWDQTLSGKVPYKSMAFRRKEDRVAFPNRLELGLRHGVQFPGGFNSGHFISMIFSRAALPYPDLRSFDDLPIPFRCVATEMVSGKETVFDHGPLGDALRATMSLPAIFLPAVKDGKVYTDGATLDNLPTGVARKLGVDIVIGVHLAPGPVDEKQLRTLTGLLSRTVRLVVSDNELRSMQLADIMIMADLKGILASDYSRWEEIAEIGHKAAEQKKNILSRFALDDADWKNHLAQRASRRKTAPQQAAFVDVEGTSQPLEDSIERRLKGFVNRPLLLPAFERELTYAVGLGRYDSLSYRFIRKNGQTGLLVQAREKEHGPPFLLPAVEIDGKDQGNVGFLFLSRLTMLDLGGYRSELRTDLTFGSRYGIATEYYRPLTTKSPVFVAVRASAQKSKVEIYEFKERVAEYGLLDYGGGLDIGVTFSRFAEWRTGYTYSAIEAERRIGSALLPNGGERTDNVSTRFAYEGQDDPVVAMHGVRLATALRYYPLGNSFWQGDFRVNAATGISPKASFIYGAAGGSSFGQSDVGLRFFSLGGPLRLGAYGPNELIGSAYFIGTAGYVREISTLPALAGDKIYVAGLFQGAKIEGPQSYTGVAMSGTGLIVAKTLLGPVFVGGSWGDRGHRRWFFGLGRVF